MNNQTSNIGNDIETMGNIVSQFDDAILNEFADKYVRILTYQTTGDKNKLIALAKRRAEFLLDNFEGRGTY